ncbi:RNA polymerase sigma factor [Emticicia sp. BO119]|uniref:RNA polymerase sigma factor n=1 Tax=Emticicia sp. BO119 TaxID=2757768 RepID=UPI0015F09976|nr:sigma-70 family RNA polymerase sigma factor [Emticicia sp. BO119]MBA4853865.1 sigma-70 family RNA polymerase sigma factor [Emticicia sp. BO119]
MDLKVFTQSVLQHQSRLFRVAKLFLKNTEEAEDTVQEIFLRLWDKRQQLDAYNSVEALAVQMTKNLCLDKLKSHAYNYTSTGLETVEVSTRNYTPHEQTELADSNELLKKIIDDLPEIQKTILHLRDVEEYSFEEIEQITGQTINNIRVILSRARKSVRDSYLKTNNYVSGN